MMGEEAKSIAAVREKIKDVMMGWNIYGGCWFHLFWCQRPTCASTLLHMWVKGVLLNKGLTEG